MSAVDSPMPLRVMRNVYLRPTRSPIRPNTNAPNGRMRNPAVNVPTVLMSAAPDPPPTAAAWRRRRGSGGGGGESISVGGGGGGGGCPAQDCSLDLSKFCNVLR